MIAFLPQGENHLSHCRLDNGGRKNAATRPIGRRVRKPSRTPSAGGEKGPAPPIPMVPKSLRPWPQDGTNDQGRLCAGFGEFEGRHPDRTIWRWRFRLSAGGTHVAGSFETACARSRN